MTAMYSARVPQGGRQLGWRGGEPVAAETQEGELQAAGRVRRRVRAGLAEPTLRRDDSSEGSSAIALPSRSSVARPYK